MARTTARHEVILSEHESVTVPRSRLYGDDLDRLRSVKAVGVVEVGNGYVLKARATTGVLQLERIRLVLRPKFPIPGKQLINWLCYANGRREPDETLRNWPLGKDGYAGLVPAALLHECRLLLRRGLRRDYVRRPRVATVLRGRLDVEAQATRCYGAVDRLHLQTFEYEDGGWENLVCGAALTVAAQRSTDPVQTRWLLDTAARFPSPRRPLDATAMLTQGQYTRLNTHYRAAHAWARLVLGGGGVTDLLDPYGFGAKSLLLNLNVLWENVVRRMAVDAATALGGRGARPGEGVIRTHGGLKDNTPPFNPDVLLVFPPRGEGSADSRFLAVDAKYKSYVTKNVSSADRHQLLTYIAGYTDPADALALVVHPAPGGSPTQRDLRVEGPRGRLGIIRVLGLDTLGTPANAAGPLRKAIADFATAPEGSGPSLP
ncbi:PE-PGRS family protein [Streptomyces phaeolivaceus]|uniref:PE-PGRS family protein n=1 Tax=Streptomyces phaeolivaceus TaxID=2653200 RepID=A0A5P8K8Y5_9ACTN|nr:PE-PGRS family protein [Streptomyces phaeolivaceus]QFQ98999.1 PE-PGRS family protein [Streptomyces phaeolivaceus]